MTLFHGKKGLLTRTVGPFPGIFTPSITPTWSACRFTLATILFQRAPPSAHDDPQTIGSVSTNGIKRRQQMTVQPPPSLAASKCYFASPLCRSNAAVDGSRPRKAR